MARWGLAARLCSLQEAEAAVVRAGRLAHAHHRSWEDFSAAYLLGRCLHFDGEEFGPSRTRPRCASTGSLPPTPPAPGAPSPGPETTA
ncbi:DUF1266 domain-containing protein [Streptomyces sp. NPDC047718]|uniref:DUF1266 domain-containing protein n=1 Tax=Streptomyces sp. NPDC047718 TaxID=3155479 RepID=UPI0033EBF0EA